MPIPRRYCFGKHYTCSDITAGYGLSVNGTAVAILLPHTVFSFYLLSICLISPTVILYHFAYSFSKMIYVGFECFESVEWEVLYQKQPSCGVDRY